MIRKRYQAEILTGIALTFLMAVSAPAAAQGQAAAAGTASYGTSAPGASSSSSSNAAATTNSSNPITNMNSAQNPFLGSVPTGEATSQPLRLSIREAMEQGLRYNLGLLLDEQSTQAARGQRWQALSKLLPQLTTDTTETRQEINLQALGFPGGIPGIPTIVGPFNTFDARASLSAPVLDLSSLRREHAASEDVRAAEYTYRDARNLVVLVVGNAYLVANAGAAQVQSIEAQVKTAQALYQQAVDRLHAGLSPQIDMLRSQVELKSRQEQLIAAQNDYATDKLNLARVIGLPTGQAVILTSKTPYAPLENVSLEQALQDAYRRRPDYQAALAAVRAAQARRRAVLAERLPSISFNSNFGDIGLTVGNSHETFAVAGTLEIPVFQGGRIHGELLQANAQLRQQQQQLQNLKGQIDYDVRTALMNLKTASDQVAVAQSNLGLASQTLDQARDRFAAGVTDNIEVVEAQEAVAAANQTYISSLYQHNLAKVTLARAAGIAEQAVLQYLGGK